MRKGVLVSWLVIGLMFLVAGCSLTSETVTTTETKVETAVPTVVIKSDGYVNIKRAADDKITMEIVREARGDKLASETYLPSIEIKTTKTETSLLVEVVKPAFPVGVEYGCANLTIWLPADLVTSLTIDTVLAPVTVENFTGILQAKTTNEEIKVTNITGEMKLVTKNAGISATNIEGQIIAQNYNGSVYIDTDRALDTVNILTENAGITYDGLISNPGNYSLITKNGSIDMYLPLGSAMNIDADTVNGEVVCDFEVDPAQVESDELIGAINGGGANVVLRTENGDISIRTQ